MPATMMHLYAAHLLNSRGSDSYFLGSILPDCVDAHREIKDKLHFRDVPPEERLQSLIRFGKSLDLNRDFDFGALLHFYLDYLWDNGPQMAHRKSHGPENWFVDYRKELSRAGSRTAQRMPWNQEMWTRLHTPAPELYENTMNLPEEDIPLADVPKTGETMIYRIMAAISGITLMALAVTGRKKEEEEMA